MDYAHIDIEQTNRQTNRHKQYLIHGGTDLHTLLFVEACFKTSQQSSFLNNQNIAKNNNQAT